MEEEYEKVVESSELERRKEILKKKRQLYKPINPSELDQH